MGSNVKDQPNLKACLNFLAGFQAVCYGYRHLCVLKQSGLTIFEIGF